METLRKGQAGEILVEYFLEALRIANAEVPGLFDSLMQINKEDFDMVYNSLLPEEQLAFDETQEFTELDEFNRYMIMSRALYRYFDALSGSTSMGADGVLEIGPNSCVLELPITLETWQYLAQNQFSTIGRLSEPDVVAALPAVVLQDATAAILAMKANRTIRWRENAL